MECMQRMWRGEHGELRTWAAGWRRYQSRGESWVMRGNKNLVTGAGRDFARELCAGELGMYEDGGED
jgi:hypothetical protein